MNLKDAVAAAKQHIGQLFAAEAPHDLRLVSFLYDDHLMVWSLTIGFGRGKAGDGARTSKIVRVSEADKSVLSVADP